MKYLMPVIILTLLLFISCGKQQNKLHNTLTVDITSGDIQTHISFLASDSLEGRATGSPGEAMAANYIADSFRSFRLQPVGDDSTYYQYFKVDMAAVKNPHQSGSNGDEADNRLSRNVVGMIRGTENPESYLVVGAHYDHLGLGKYGSLDNRNNNAIHNGADDNASGTAGVLELAQYFADHPPRKSMIFVAFSGEEIGLLGSQYFVEYTPVPIEQIEAMVNLDMIGRLQDNKLLIFGTGSSPSWLQLVNTANTDSINLKLVPDGTGASDHTSFYNKKIPVLHYFTDTHADYHRPSDDPQYINYEGEEKVLHHVLSVVQQLDSTEEGQLAFTEVPKNQQQRTAVIEGVTLGVTPDYGFEGTGLRITGVSSDGPAGEAGLQEGDIIIKLDGQPLEDIYEYMEVLNTLNEGESSTVTVKRGNEELTFNIQF